MSVIHTKIFNAGILYADKQDGNLKIFRDLEKMADAEIDELKDEINKLKAEMDVLRRMADRNANDAKE